MAILAAAPLAPALAKPSLESARERATALSRQIEAQGAKLSLANERYNQAAVRRAQLAASMSAAQRDAAAAERRWAALRARLAERVRTLYMHPGAPLAAWLSMRSLNEDARARVLSNSVLTSDASLVEQTDRARLEVRRKSRELAGLSADAERNVDALNAERARVKDNLATERSLLAEAQGDVAKYLEADRRRQLAQASRRAAAETKPADQPTITSPTTQDPKKDEPLAPPPPPSSGAAKAVQTARNQIGKPYEWAAAGPDNFDCSGLTMYAWASAGVQMPHSAAAQYDMFPKVPRAQLRPGDLIAFGSPIHHIGIYEGGGIMIEAPQTGENVRRASIDRADYVGAARP